MLPASLLVSPHCHSSRGHSDVPTARAGMTVQGRRVVEERAAGRKGQWIGLEGEGRRMCHCLSLGPEPGLCPGAG